MPDSIAVQNVYAELESQAIRTACAIINYRASEFALAPILLDSIEDGLSCLSPRKLSARIAELLEDEHTTQRRYTGFGGEIPMINLHAAARYAARLCEIERAKPCPPMKR